MSNEQGRIAELRVVCLFLLFLFFFRAACHQSVCQDIMVTCGYLCLLLATKAIWRNLKTYRERILQRDIIRYMPFSLVFGNSTHLPNMDEDGQDSYSESCARELPMNLTCPGFLRMRVERFPAA